MALAPGTTVEEAERRLIMMTLAHTGDNKTRAAEILGISLKTLAQQAEQASAAAQALHDTTAAVTPCA